VLIRLLRTYLRPYRKPLAFLLALQLAQSRYNLGLSSIVEFSQAELEKTEADITNTDARYQYRLSQIILAFTLGRKL